MSRLEPRKHTARQQCLKELFADTQSKLGPGEKLTQEQKTELMRFHAEFFDSLSDLEREGLAKRARVHVVAKEHEGQTDIENWHAQIRLAQERRAA